jgi:hypothetical protein
MLLDVARAARHNYVVIPIIILGGVSHVQYADDATIVFQPEDMAIANLNFMLLCFENIPGLRIYFHKSEAMVLRTTPEEQYRMTNRLNCKLGSFTFTYMGLPINDSALIAGDWGSLGSKVGKQADQWMGKFMSLAARLS